MERNNKPAYVPALRFKAGEYRALEKLAPDVADRIVPRFVLPPPGERDPEDRRVLTKDEILYKTGMRIGKHWPMRSAFVEPGFLFNAFGETDSVNWLPRIFAVARQHNAIPVPVATLDDMIGDRAESFKKAIAAQDQLKIAVRVTSSEIDSDLAQRVAVAMSVFGVDPRECALLLDFSDAHFADVDVISDFTNSALETVQEIGLWQRTIFQGTNYPDKNAANEDSTALIERNEWLAWKKAATNNENVLTHLTFGDYCADNARFIFRSGGGSAPIPHYRYCADMHWRVIRGKSNVRHDEAMRGVCQKILKSGDFAGRDFSSADEFIYGTAKGHSGPGNATTWREINTVHHITHVVSELGNFLGYDIQRKTVVDPAIQHELL